MTRTCAACARQLHGSCRHDTCLACRKSRACAGCGTRISIMSTGHCRTCANAIGFADQDRMARHAAVMRAHNSDPALAAHRHEKAKKTAATKKRNGTEVIGEIGRTIGRLNIVHTHTPEAKAKRAASNRARWLGDIPVAYHGLYLELRGHKVPSTEARRMVFEQQAADEARRLAAMTPLERQIDRVRNGARVVEKFRPAAVEHAFTLGGVSGELL